jgi:PST family polysaccharide transporter
MRGPVPEEGLSRRTMIGMAWAYGSYAGGRVLVLVATAILARLLTPDDFGLVALALTFTGFLDMLKDFGVAEALVVTDEEEVEDKAETAFVIMQFGGLFVFGVTVLLGPVAAGFYDEPELRWMLPALGLTFVLRSLGATHYALAQKRLDFRARTVAEMADVVGARLHGHRAGDRGRRRLEPRSSATWPAPPR